MSTQKQKPLIVPKEPIQDEDLSTDASLSELEMDDLSPPEFATHMLNTALGNFFMYTDEDGKSLNIADILLMIKTSIDKNSKCILKLQQEVEALRAEINQ